jgi:hypothetical protein
MFFIAEFGYRDVYSKTSSNKSDLALIVTLPRSSSVCMIRPSALKAATIPSIRPFDLLLSGFMLSPSSCAGVRLTKSAMYFDPSETFAELNLKPLPMAESARDAVRWYRQQHWI